jgi:hypothetical protein
MRQVTKEVPLAKGSVSEALDGGQDVLTYAARVYLFKTLRVQPEIVLTPADFDAYDNSIEGVRFTYNAETEEVILNHTSKEGRA